VTLFDQLVNDVGPQEPGDTSNLRARRKIPLQAGGEDLDVPRRVEETFVCFILLSVCSGGREISSTPTLIFIHNGGGIPSLSAHNLRGRNLCKPVTQGRFSRDDHFIGDESSGSSSGE
jgi:hypothetical protein